MTKEDRNRQAKKDSFRLQQFEIKQDRCAMKVGTDGMLLGAWGRIEEVRRVLDIGTGTGLIALMLAQRQSDAELVGVEVDVEAATQAADNVAASPFGDRIKIHTRSIQDFCQTHTDLFDLIISNPPFFSGGVLSEQEGRANVRHTVKLPHQDLLRSVQRLLQPEGSFCLVLPWIEGLRFQELAASYQLHTHRLVKVRPNPEKAPNRLLLELKKSPTLREEPEMSDLSIYERPGADAPYSEAYQLLTAEFYLKA